jgi:hypothetical protein
MRNQTNTKLTGSLKLTINYFFTTFDVLFQFLSLKVGDERNQLIPVLNTMLKLSAEEKLTLQKVAQGIFVHYYVKLFLSF